MWQQLILVCILAALSASAQHGNFKKPLTREDTLFLKKTAEECFHFNPKLQFSYNNTDLANDTPTKGDLPANNQNIQILEEAIRNHPGDAGLYMELSGMYGRLGQTNQAREARKKAFDAANLLALQHPDSAQMQVSIGEIYMSALLMDSSLACYRRAIALQPLNKDANRLIPFIHILNGHFDSAYAFINRQIRTYPTSYETHEALPVYYIYKFYDQLHKYSRLRHLDESKLFPENILGMKLLKDYYDEDPGDFKREYLYRVTYQVCYSTLITYKTVNDSLFNPRQIRFSVSLKDAEKLREQELFFKKHLKGKTPANKYLVNKALGNICLLTNRPGEAIPFLQKTIKLKPVKYSTVGNNASEDYDNLLTAYFLQKDTLAYEACLQKKIKELPAIDPVATDYINAGKIAISRRQLAFAEIAFERALQLDSTQADACLGLALLCFRKDDREGALRYINQAFAMDVHTWELYVLYGIVSLCNRDPVNAFEAFKEARKLHNSTWIKTDLMEKYFDIF